MKHKIKYKGYFQGQCARCGKETIVCQHHLLYGTGKRKWADKYDLVRPMCHDCHTYIHNVHEEALKWKVIGQIQFEKEHPELDFIEVFGRNYL